LEQKVGRFVTAGLSEPDPGLSTRDRTDSLRSGSLTPAVRKVARYLNGIGL